MKSSYRSSGSEYVEVALSISGTVAVRDSKDSESAAVLLHASAEASFIASV
ncbi:DUF397 domain-containing protein [Streptomyces sp. NPDC004288]